MSEQQAEPTSAETAGATVPASSDATAAPVVASEESPRLVPDKGEAGDMAKTDAPDTDVAKAEAPKVEAPKVEAPKVEAPKVEAPKAEAPKVEASKPDVPRSPGNIMIMAPGDRTWDGSGAGPKAKAAEGVEASGKRRMSAMAAVVALATVAGALGGALATAGLGHLLKADPAAANSSPLEASVARIDADILALKASVEHTAKTGTTQFNNTSDRLDKVEKAQSEPSAKLAKLSDAVEKLRAAQAAASAPVAAAPAAAKDVTGSIAPPATAAPKPEIARLPTVEGWVLRDAGSGFALIQGRQGIFEVYAGDPVPGLGRVDAIRKQDGRWVVVTSKGLIVAR